MMPPPTKAEFRRLFARVWFNHLRTPFIASLARPDYKNPETIAAILEDLKSRIPPARTGAPVPRRIFMLWQQGWDKAPAIVRTCAESWREKNPDWELVLLDEQRLPEWAPDYPSLSERITARTGRSNVARLNLLSTHGGVWADATLFCARPLDDWLASVAGKGMFLFSGPRPYRPCEIWFMAASAGDPLLSVWRDAIAVYWRAFARPHHYYWMEYILGLVLARDERLNAVWESMPKVPPHASEIVAANRFDANAPRAVFDLIERGQVPVHKLSHKWPYDSQPLAGTPIGTLTGLDKL